MQQRHPGPEARRRILAAALALFAERGYAGTSVRDLAEHLGVTKAAITHHFPAKEQILAELVEAPVHAVDEVLRAHAGAEPEVLLAAFLAVLARQPPAYHAVITDPSTGALAGLAERVGRQRERLAVLVAGPDPDADQLLRARTAVAVLQTGALLADPADTPGERLAPQRQRVLVTAAVAALRSRPDGS